MPNTVNPPASRWRPLRKRPAGVDRKVLRGDRRTSGRSSLTGGKVKACLIGAGVALAVVLIVEGGAVLWYAHKTTDAMLYQRGAPDLPSSKVTVIMNPFRNRMMETTAEQLITALRSADCEDVLRSLNADDGNCELLRRSGSQANLIYRKDGRYSRVLVYDLPATRSRLWLVFGPSKAGWTIRSVAVIR